MTDEGKKVIIAAADTFRAAAIDQISIWAERAGIDIVKHQDGSDPAAVVFDALKAACARDADVVICDTAGRLHNKKNLMGELEKILRVINRELPDSVKKQKKRTDPFRAPLPVNSIPAVFHFVNIK